MQFILLCKLSQSTYFAHIYIYIYIERERERERDVFPQPLVYIDMEDCMRTKHTPVYGSSTMEDNCKMSN